MWHVLLPLILLSGGEGDRLGVLNVRLSGFDASVAQTAIDALATAASSIPGRQVISKAELDAMIGAEQLKDTMGCDDVSCMAEIGMAAGIRWLLTGSLSRMERSVVVSLQLIDTSQARAENRVTLSWPNTEPDLPALLGVAVEQLLIPKDAQKPGVVTLTGVPADALIAFDGTPWTGGPTAITNATLGLHTLRVDADDFEPFEKPVIVRNGSVTPVSVSLVEKAAPPVYSRWWFWTIIGTAVAGGTVTAVLLSRSDKENGGNDKTPDVYGSGTAVVSVPWVPGAP